MHRCAFVSLFSLSLLACAEPYESDPDQNALTAAAGAAKFPPATYFEYESQHATGARRCVERRYSVILACKTQILSRLVKDPNIRPQAPDQTTGAQLVRVSSEGAELAVTRVWPLRTGTGGREIFLRIWMGDTDASQDAATPEGAPSTPLVLVTDRDSSISNGSPCGEAYFTKLGYSLPREIKNYLYVDLRQLLEKAEDRYKSIRQALAENPSSTGTSSQLSNFESRTCRAVATRITDIRLITLGHDCRP